MQDAKQQHLPAQSNQHSTTSSSTETTPSNSEVIKQLGTGPELPKTDSGQADSEHLCPNGWWLIRLIAPQRSGLKLAITGAIPLYKAPGIDVTFKPSPWVLKINLEN